MKLATRLLRWYRTHGRDLPWRKTQDPYKILVSEIMLQQTQVARVRDHYYDAWLAQFPTWSALGQASNAEVIHAWAGLGYNRRALMLRDIAKHVSTDGLPTTEEEWRAIKGIGPYTAAAVSAFAQHKRTLPIDTNIRRVLGRLLLNIPFATLKNDEAIRAHTDNFLPTRGQYWDVPQAIFDLATMICTKNPNCVDCPMRNHCPMATAFMNNEIEIPKRATKKPTERIHAEKNHPDRIYRGRILKLIREHGRTHIRSIGPEIDPTYDPIADEQWIDDMCTRLANDGLLNRTNTHVWL